MKLYKNVDIKDLQSILANGILPISVTGNDNWEDDYRSNNSRDVVYLFKALNHGDTFVQYGLALIEVEVEAIINQMNDADVNKDSYIEYVVNEVKPEQITNIYVPSFVDCNDSKVTKINYTCSYYKATGRFSWELIKLEGEIKELFEKTAKTSTSVTNYLRGLKSDNTMIDTKNWKYEF